MGRTGRWFAFEHEGIVPDIIVLSKAIGGMGLPLSVIVYHKRLDVWEPGAHAGTFRGNQMAMAAGIAAIQFMRDHELVAHAEESGINLMTALQSSLGHSPLIAQIRGRGLMLGIETTSTATAKALRAECLARGLIIELGGRGDRVMRLLPPLVITDEHIEKIVEILNEAFSTVEQAVVPPLEA